MNGPSKLLPRFHLVSVLAMACFGTGALGSCISGQRYMLSLFRCHNVYSFHIHLFYWNSRFSSLQPCVAANEGGPEQAISSRGTAYEAINRTGWKHKTPTEYIEVRIENCNSCCTAWEKPKRQQSNHNLLIPHLLFSLFCLKGKEQWWFGSVVIANQRFEEIPKRFARIVSWRFVAIAFDRIEWWLHSWQRWRQMRQPRFAKSNANLTATVARTELHIVDVKRWTFPHDWRRHRHRQWKRKRQ